MSVESMAIVLHHSKASGTAKLVMVGIANHDGDGGAWPSMMRLATYAGVNLSNVKRALAKLVEAGEITVESHGGGQVNTPEHARTNLYRINVRCPENCDGTAQHRRMCLVCGSVLPFARYAQNTHKLCTGEPVDKFTDDPGALAHRGASGSYEPSQLPANNFDHSSFVKTAGARELESVDYDGHTHVWVEHNGSPWRCAECGRHVSECGAGA